MDLDRGAPTASARLAEKNAVVVSTRAGSLRHGRVAASTLALTLALTSIARAQSGSPETAEAALRRGIALRTQGNNDDALVEFQRAYALAPSPTAAAQLGLVEQALARWIDAERHLVEALAASNDRWVQHNRDALERAMEVIRQHLGTLQLRVSESGAEVRVDGAPVGTTPLASPLRLRAGEITLEVRREGFYPVSRRLTIVAEATSLEVVELHAQPSAAPPEVASSPPPEVASASPSPSPSPEPSSSPEPTRNTRARGALGPGFWLATGGAVLSLAAFVVAIAVRESAAAQFNASANHCSPNASSGVCGSWLALDQPMVGLAIGSAIVGAGSIVTAVVLFERDRGARTTRARLACGLTGEGAVCAGTF